MQDAWGRWVHRHRKPVLVASGVALLASFAGLAAGGTLSTGDIDGIEAQQAQALAEEALGLPGDASFLLIFSSDALTYDTPAFQEAMTRGLARLRTDERLTVQAPMDLPPALAQRFVSNDRRAAFAVVAVDAPVKQAARIYPALRASVEAAPLDVHATGHLAFMQGLDETLADDLLRAELVSLPLALVVLVLVFGSLVAATLPLGVGVLAVMCGVAAVLGLSRVTDMAQYTLNVVSLIGLGVAIDYSLFIVSRFRDELRAGRDVEHALGRTFATAGRAVLFSGVAVGAGLSGLLFFRGSYLASMGLAGSVVVTLAVLFALTFLPALLSLLGPRVDAGRLRKPRQKESGGAWHTVAVWVMKHPILVLLPTLACLLTLGAPFLRLQLAATDVTVLPADTEARQGFDLLQAKFPAQAANRVLVVVDFPMGSPLEPERIGALYDASRRIAQLPGVRGVESIVDLDPRMDRATYQQLASAPVAMRPPELNAAFDALVGGTTTVLQVLAAGEPSDPRAQALVRDIRAAGSIGGGQVLVGGATAHDMDATAFVRERTPWAVGFVMLVSGLVLFLLLGSVLLPIKAMLMNVLSIAGSFGAMVWIFQDGNLSGLLGFEPRPLEPALPPLLFCLVFGLSMDYEVLLLSRIDEEYRHTGDNTLAVAHGLEKTAGIITSAAAIMVAVFAAFALAHVVVVKAMGVGLALAVALDATLVRVLLVPATMRLFGRLNWWAPAPFARFFEARRARHDAFHHGP